MTVMKSTTTDGPRRDDLPVDLLRRLYHMMILIRVAEERIADLVEAKEIRCPCHLYIGQEAIAAGVCAALTQDDYVWGGHRSHGHYLAKGGDLKGMMAEIYGKETGCAKGRGGSMHLFAPKVGILGTVPLVAATIPLAVGAALASKLRKDGRVSVSFFGDGATEEGHFHESVNLAALYQLPTIFVCENNLYSSHLGLLERRRADNIHMTGEAHGIEGIRIDGNDVLEVYLTTRRLVEQARKTGMPSLIEARTYRWRGHVGPSWDTDVGVKRKDELKEWLPKDPVARLRKVMEARGIPAAEFDTVHADVKAEVEASIAFARQAPYPSAAEAIKDVYLPTRENS